MSALVLTIGAIVEYWHKLKLLAFLLLKWSLGKSTPFDRCIFKRLLLHSIGPILVVLGIAGEVVFEGRTFVVEDRQEEQARKIVGSLGDQVDVAQHKVSAVEDEATALKKQLDVASTQIGTLSTETGDAKKSAKIARGEADAAIGDEKQIRADLKKATANAEAAQIRLEKEQQETARAQKEAAEAQRKLNEFLLARAFPRSLKIPLRSALKSLPPAKAEIWYKDTDFEAFLFAQAIQVDLALAGWNLPKNPIPVPDQRFNVNDLPMAGVAIYDHKAALWFAGSVSVEFTEGAIESEGINEITARRLAILMAGIDCQSVIKESSLEENSLRIVVSARSPF